MNNRTHKTILSLSSIAALLLLAASTLANTTITYQGQLKQSGTPYNGTADLEFALFDQLNGGDQVGPVEAHDDWPVSDGLFQVELDFGPVFDGSPLFLEVRVDGTPLSPRQPITAAPMALYAPDNSPWQSSGNTVYVMGNTVGINTPNPMATFGVNGSVRLGPDNQASGHASLVGGGEGNIASGIYSATLGGSLNQASENMSLAAGFRAKANHPNSFVWADGENADFASTAGNQFLIRAAGGVGIGTSTPTSPLHVTSSSATRTITGENSATGFSFGVEGRGSSSIGGGVLGVATGPGGFAGVWGSSSGSIGRGVHGEGWSGVWGESISDSGRGVFGLARSLTGEADGVRGQSDSTSGRGVYGVATASGGTNYGVYGETNSNNGFAGYFVGGRNYFEGNVGIGTATSSDKLAINADDGQNALRVVVGSTTRLRVYGTGGVGVGSNMLSSPPAGGNLAVSNAVSINVSGNDPTPFRLAVNGTAANSNGVWATISDRRLKHSIEPLVDPGGLLDALLSLKTYSYEYHAEAIDERLASPGRQIGLMAQEVAEVFPDWVDTDADGYLYLTPRGINAILIEALRGLRDEKDREIAALHQQIEQQRVDIEGQLTARASENHRHEGFTELAKRVAALERDARYRHEPNNQMVSSTAVCIGKPDSSGNVAWVQ